MMNKRMIEGAARYAAAERSDPFAYDRAMSHVANGVAGFRHNPAGLREDAFYDAKPGKQERTLPNGEKYEVTVYDSVVRP